MNIYFYKSFLDVIKNDSNENRRNDILLALHIMRKHHVLDVYLTDFFSLLDANCLKERLCLYQHSGIKFLIMSISWVCSSQGSSLFWSEHYSDNSKINQDYEKCRKIRNKSLQNSKKNMNTINQSQQLEKIISLSNQVNWTQHKKRNIEFLFLLKTLRKHHILSKFLYNVFKVNNESSLFVSIIRLDYASEIISAIDFCMTWASTPEGSHFWSDIYYGTTELGQKIHKELEFYSRFLT